MTIWRVPYKLQILTSGGAERSPGVHVSDVIRDLALRGRQLDIKFADNSTMSPERIELGIAFEERLPKHHPEICFHPGEFRVDDIAMTIDALSFMCDDTSIFHPTGKDMRTPAGEKLQCWNQALHEIKLTWQSSRRDLSADFMKMTQGKSYLKGASEEFNEKIRTIYWHMFYVNGNYSRNDSDPDNGPTYQIWGAQFTDLEIRENWDMVRSHRDRMLTPGTQVSLSSLKRGK